MGGKFKPSNSFFNEGLGSRIVSGCDIKENLNLDGICEGAVLKAVFGVRSRSDWGTLLRAVPITDWGAVSKGCWVEH